MRGEGDRDVALPQEELLRPHRRRPILVRSLTMGAEDGTGDKVRQD